MFTSWYLAEVQKQMESGNSTDEIEVDLRLSVLKQLQGLTSHPAGPVVQKVDSAIHRINRYPMDKYYEN